MERTRSSEVKDSVSFNISSLVKLTCMVFWFSLHQERHRSVCVWHRERRLGGLGWPANARRPDPVGQRWGPQVGHSRGHCGASQGRTHPNSPVQQFQSRHSSWVLICAAVLCGVNQDGDRQVQGWTLPLWAEALSVQPGTTSPLHRIQGTGNKCFKKLNLDVCVKGNESSGSKRASQSCSDSGDLQDQPSSSADRKTSADSNRKWYEDSIGNEIQPKHILFPCSCWAPGDPNSGVHQRPQWHPGDQHSGRRREPAGWHSHLHSHDESGRPCRSDTEAQGAERRLQVQSEVQELVALRDHVATAPLCGCAGSISAAVPYH